MTDDGHTEAQRPMGVQTSCMTILHRKFNQVVDEQNVGSVGLAVKMHAFGLQTRWRRKINHGKLQWTARQDEFGFANTGRSRI